MILRDYQNKTIAAAREAFTSHSSIILTIPTGGGKTVIFSFIANRTIQKGGRVMILCDRKELIKQASNKVSDYGLAPTIIAPGYPQHKNNLYLASVDTLRRRELPEIDLLIIDEAHKQTFDPIIARYKEAIPDLFIIGATATPLRTGAQQCLSISYQSIVGQEISISYLIEHGFLIKERTFAAKKDLSNIKITAGDYDSKQMFDAFNSVKLYDDVVGKYSKLAPGTKALCFNVNVEHSKKMRDSFLAAGISAMHIDANSTDRDEVLAKFKAGEFLVLCNCSILTTGYDEPSIETVIINRATKSLTLYLQMCGRGGRPHTNKSNFTIIDMGSNVYEHGLWSDERAWNLIKPKKKASSGVAAVKMCHSCEYINPISARTCKECLTPFPIKEKKLLDGEFEEIKKAPVKTKGLTLAQLHALAKEKGYAPGWAFRMDQINKRERITTKL